MESVSRRGLVFGGGSFISAGLIFGKDLAEAAMIEPVSTSENIMYCTTRIVGTNAHGVPLSTGTGFFYAFQTTENRAIRTELHEWIEHPNPKVDLCAVPFGGVAQLKSPVPFFKTIAPLFVPSQQQLEALDAVEDVLMVGYPNGLWDEKNNYPLLRRGITASHPAVDFDVNGVPTTVVDISCFPGSSGSPVFIYNNGTIPDKKGNISIGQRVYFLGVLFSGPVITTDGKIVIRNIPTVSEPIAQINLMINLGYIIKSHELAALGDVIRARLGLPPP